MVENVIANLKSSSIFDHHHSNISSNVLRDKQSNASDNLIVLDDDDDDDDTELHENEEHTTLKTLIPKLDIDTELIHVQPNLPMRICTAGLFYSNLPQTHVIIVNHSLVVSPKCIIKRQLYLSKPNPLLSLPIRTRIYNRYLSLSGFILEKPCAIKNSNRYLIIYDNFTAYYHSQTEFHLCLCQDFEKHLTNIDYLELRTYYRDAFRYSNQSKQSNLTVGTIIRVRKFGTQYHNARIVDKDCSIIKICFFERKSQTEMWIHLNSSIIEPTLTKELNISSSSTCQNPIKDLIISSNSDLLCLRKRKTNANDINEGTKKLRDRSNTQRLTMPQRLYSSSSDDTQPPVASSRANMLTVYYTSILLPKFRILNNIPYIVHNCSQQCILSVEKNFLPNKIHINPYLLPFECQWSIIDGKPRGYRTPCHRTFYSLDDIEKYLYRTDSQLSIKFFIDDLLTRFTPAIDTFDRKFIINNDLSNGQENILISVFNDIDNDKPDNFTYVTETHSFDNEIYAQYKDSSKTSCCNCTDNCNDRMKCACFRKTLKQAMLNHDPLVTEKQKNRYTLSNIIKSIGYQRKRLLNPVLSGIYECNSKCSCHLKHCSNRLVQQGLFVQLQLFKDKNKGWGLRTLHDIPRGTYICQYIGELITSDEGNDRAQTMDDRYQTSLDLVKQIRYEINNGEEYNDNDEDPYVIDGNLYANLGKYFNHSCEPNMYIQNVFIESHDLHFPNLALFTRTRVKAGEELTWHYNCELLPDREVKCFCGSKNCPATATAGAIAITTASLSSSQSLSQSTDDSSTAAVVMTQPSSTSHLSDIVRQKSTTMPTNHCSSIQLQDDTSSASSKTRLLQRMISLRRSSSSKPSTPILSSHVSSTSSSCRSYNVRAFEIARDRNLRHYPCIIHFLDDTERIFHIDRRCKGIDLLNEVFDYLDLSTERKYFGLLIEDLTQDFAYRWLDSTKILKKQLTTMSPYHLYFKVRFFLTDPSTQIDDEFTKYLYVLQIKKELLSGKMWCPRSTGAILASYLVQSELGDYDSNEHRQGYLEDFRFVPFQNPEFENEVEQYHKQHKGQSPADAEVNYLHMVSSLDMYGVELHKASVKVSNTNDNVNNSIVELYVGVCAIGISVFQNSTKLNTFPWDRITKISFKRRTFYIQLVKNLNSPDDNSIVFTLRSYRCCKYLWKSCVDHHTFFRLTTISPSPKKFFQFTNKFRQSNDVIPNGLIMEANGKKPKTFERVSSRRNSRVTNGSSTLPANNTLSLNRNSNLKTVLFLSSSSVSISKSDKLANNRSPPPPKPPRQPFNSTKNSFANNNALIEANEYKPKNATLPRNNEYRNSTDMLNETTYIDENISKQNSDTILIRLQSDDDGRYGFNVKGGGDEHTPFVISRVALNTPANRALLQEGDHILSINNIDIQNHSHDEVVNMIRQSRERPSGELELLIRPLQKCQLTINNDTDSEDAYDNGLLNLNSKDPLEQSVETLRDDLSTGHLIEQYEILQRRKEGFTFEIATSQNNYYRNRYKDVLPYDQTRVILKSSSDSDYINANFINMPITSTDIVNRYIATQGPLPTTCEAFWTMIWEQECTLLIMLTTLFENGRIKCHQYWPNVLETNDYGLFSIRCRRERKENQLIYREFLFSNKETNEERIIYQIQTETWPDHGVPNDFSSFVDFVLEIRELRKSNNHLPILVHCSAGIGRTGVLILMETALCLIETNQPIFPLDIVRQMREQRLGMIQTASQYQFACGAVLYAYDQGLVQIGGN
ncbi:unnamed protein product [Adineta steineri]|uniref:protein-tyrosine-phosphatase n=1 Tax=Adineta steineri TaxID=433720 RepID=A0A814DR47_9BILA|nr:unnamed protein product [Adineta steineri]CAF3491697.1 unnamed protein product [Adineta steineri]CAF3631728.1 unnamed protein product [Adineta steineri]